MGPPFLIKFLLLLVWWGPHFGSYTCYFTVGALILDRIQLFLRQMGYQNILSEDHLGFFLKAEEMDEMKEMEEMEEIY